MNKVAVICNPCAGLRRAAKYLPDIERIFFLHGYKSNIYKTRKSGDGIRLVREHAADSDIVVCIGGDGTLNEVITGMIDCSIKKPIGYIPAGSTNDFASGLKLSRDIITAAKDIMEGSPHTLDIGWFNGRYFSYIASCGAFTKASYSTPQPKKNVIGHLAYVLEGIKEIPNIHPVHLRIEVNGQIYEDYYIFAAVCNSTSLGGILTLNANIVNMNDGKFELMLVKAPVNIAQLGQIVFSLQAQNYDCEMIKLCSSDRFMITCREKVDWTLDGEYGKGNELIEIKNLHNAIELIVNGR